MDYTSFITGVVTTATIIAFCLNFFVVFISAKTSRVGKYVTFKRAFVVYIIANVGYVVSWLMNALNINFGLGVSSLLVMGIIYVVWKLLAYHLFLAMTWRRAFGTWLVELIVATVVSFLVAYGYVSSLLNDL